MTNKACMIFIELCYPEDCGQVDMNFNLCNFYNM